MSEDAAGQVAGAPVPTTSDAEDALVSSARSGDQEAFDQIVHLHTPRVYRLAYRMLGSAGDAEDCVQETWLSVWRHLHSFRGEARLSTYLYRVTTNAALMQLRRKRGREEPLEAVGDIADRTIDRPDERAVRSDARRAVRLALAQINPEQRAPLVLREFEGLSYEEVADVLGLSVSAVKSRLHRARLTLARLLEEWR